MTDRTNIVELSALGKNVPVRHGYDREAEGYEYEWGESRYYSMFNNDEARVKRFMYLDQETNATTGKATGACDDDEQNEQALTNCKHLNAASGYFDGGLVQMGHIWYHPFGRTFHYMSTRNNDFTNRSQKATIVLKAWKLTLVLGSVGLLFALCCLRGAVLRRRLQSDPSHRLHTSWRGRCLLRLGARLDRWYHRSWLHRAPWSVFLFVIRVGHGRGGRQAAGKHHRHGGWRKQRRSRP